ncbi:hypothetical protein [Rhodopseudomonas telluris]|uniref:Uncharacterized protein n=1 Tax=Rhodopseudomonas telluris TaxID=644215 RepID=A0ABV6EZH8_9BRAD
MTPQLRATIELAIWQANRRLPPDQRLTIVDAEALDIAPTDDDKAYLRTLDAVGSAMREAA